MIHFFFAVGLLLIAPLTQAKEDCTIRLTAHWKSYYLINKTGERATYSTGRMVESNKVSINLPWEKRNRTNTTTYARTGRGLESAFFKGLVEEENLKDKTVLDVGTGEGVLVKELRAAGVDAYGTDIFLTQEQLDTGFLFPADTEALPFYPQQFDVVVSSHSTFYYSHDADLMARQLRELKRVLTTGGHILIFGGVNEEFDHALAKVPGLDRIPTPNSYKLIKFVTR
ncbi:MAG: class I SAM-dependent methyltransferase [Bdellovibrionales bacterium]